MSFHNRYMIRDRKTGRYLNLAGTKVRENDMFRDYEPLESHPRMFTDEELKSWMQVIGSKLDVEPVMVTILYSNPAEEDDPLG